ncbi:MAG TPA: YceH family protein [Thermoanaerobaculia bacterium]|nr:YceH family protein [Thermoanaerobaculia bacterium]
MQLERRLDPIEARALGSLLEKQLATPEYYPLTLNALLAACNQKSNRDPVMELSEEDVRRAMGRLQELQLVWEIHGGRAVRFDHRLDGRWGLTPATKAIMTLLLLRGPQTPGELRGRSDRLHRFETVDQVEGELRYLSQGDEALVRELPRRPGQKESRWTDLVREGAGEGEDMTPLSAPAESLSGRVERLEAEIEELRAEIRALRESLGA